MNEENWSQSSEKIEDPIPLGLVDIEECEDLIQQNKSEKKHQDSNYILKHIAGLKNKEESFYMSLNLNNDLKKRMFKIGHEEDLNMSTPKKPSTSDLVFLQHPLEGNLIFTKKDLEEKFPGQILKRS